MATDFSAKDGRVLRAWIDHFAHSTYPRLNHGQHERLLDMMIMLGEYEKSLLEHADAHPEDAARVEAMRVVVRQANEHLDFIEVAAPRREG